jgi:vacuolar-type H+-ATPase subunit C/Vma6
MAAGGEAGAFAAGGGLGGGGRVSAMERKELPRAELAALLELPELELELELECTEMTESTSDMSSLQ